MSWRLQLEDGLAADFETNLSGLGTELGTGAYNMRYGSGNDPTKIIDV